MSEAAPSRRSVILGALIMATMPPLGAQSAPAFRRGINIHHMLNWPASTRTGDRQVYTWPPFRSSRYQMSDGEILALKATGFDFVRLTIDPSIIIVSADDRRNELRAILLDVIRRFLDKGLGVIADLHPVAVNPDFAPRALVDAQNPSAFGAYKALVAQVAGWLAPFSGQKLVFELMNEPILTGEDGFRRWQDMLVGLHDAARREAPELALLLTGANWGALRALMRVDTAPFRKSNVFYTFHYYDPHSFTHQGVGNEHARYLFDLGWPASGENFDLAFQNALTRIEADRKLGPAEREQAIATTRKLINDYILTGHNRERITADFTALAHWARQNHITPDRIVLGEFGCVRHQGQARANAAGLTWLEAVRIEAEKQQFPWAFWAYKGYGGMALRDERPGARLDPDQLRALGLEPV